MTLTKSKNLPLKFLVFLFWSLTGCDPLTAMSDPTYKIVMQADTAELKKLASSGQSTDAIMEEGIRVINSRLKQVSTKQPVIVRLGADKIGVEIAGIKDVNIVRELLGTPGKRLSFRSVVMDAYPVDIENGKAPAGSEILYMRDGNSAIAVRILGGINGSSIVRATSGFDAISNEPIVNIEFNMSGAKKFAAMTSQNIGKTIAIVLDGKVISAPRVNEPILGGEVQISGSFSVQEANELAANLNAGALPTKLYIREFSIVK